MKERGGRERDPERERAIVRERARQGKIAKRERGREGDSEKGRWRGREG